MSKLKDQDWNDILTLVNHCYRDKPDDFVISIGHWFTPVPGILEANGMPRPEMFSAWLKLTLCDFRRYAEPCEWTPRNETAFNTNCGNVLDISYGTGEFEYCPYCGRRLTTARTGQGGDSAREGDPDPEVSTTPE